VHSVYLIKRTLRIALSYSLSRFSYDLIASDNLSSAAEEKDLDMFFSINSGNTTVGKGGGVYASFALAKGPYEIGVGYSFRRDSFSFFGDKITIVPIYFQKSDPLFTKTDFVYGVEYTLINGVVNNATVRGHSFGLYTGIRYQFHRDFTIMMAIFPYDINTDGFFEGAGIFGKMKTSISYKF